MQDRPDVAILALGTAIPAFRANQMEVAQWMIASFASQPVLGRWLRGLYASSGVATRYSCIDDFLQPPDRSRFAPGRPLDEIATTAERMAIYTQESPALGAAAASKALTRLAEATATSLAAVTCSITHLVITTCTGFFAPGLDLALAQRLDLDPRVDRTMIGFMGCSAAFNGLRMAAQIVRGQPSARVLLVCVELCSLHVQPGSARESLISASLFADGAAACIVGEPGMGGADRFLLDGFFTQIKPDSQDAMVWQIGNHGFSLRLSPQIPRDLAEIAPAAVRHLCPEEQVQFWAIHPGGPAIVDRLAEVFALAPEQVAASRAVLRHYGNLSSGTILFVLDELRAHLQQKGERQTGLAMAFGPGLVIEVARLTYLPARLKTLDGQQLAGVNTIGE